MASRAFRIPSFYDAAALCASSKEESIEQTHRFATSVFQLFLYLSRETKTSCFFISRERRRKRSYCISWKAKGMQSLGGGMSVPSCRPKCCNLHAWFMRQHSDGVRNAAGYLEKATKHSPPSSIPAALEKRAIRYSGWCS